jgi:hypothetical protein
VIEARRATDALASSVRIGASWHHDLTHHLRHVGSAANCRA